MTTHSHGSLVIEDDEALTRQLCLALEIRGYDVMSARAGSVGLRSIVTLRPELVLLDLDLPDINAAVILQVMRTYHSTMHIPTPFPPPTRN